MIIFPNGIVREVVNNKGEITTYKDGTIYIKDYKTSIITVNHNNGTKVRKK